MRCEFGPDAGRALVGADPILRAQVPAQESFLERAVVGSVNLGTNEARNDLFDPGKASGHGHINALREKVKAVTGIYPHEAVKQHYKEIVERQEAPSRRGGRRSTSLIYQFDLLTTPKQRVDWGCLIFPIAIALISRRFSSTSWTIAQVRRPALHHPAALPQSSHLQLARNSQESAIEKRDERRGFFDENGLNR
jgi:hypothetical protein